MKLWETIQKQKKPLIGLVVWLLVLMLVAGFGSGAVQTAGVVLLILSLLGIGCVGVFYMMRAVS